MADDVTDGEEDAAVVDGDRLVEVAADLGELRRGGVVEVDVGAVDHRGGVRQEVVLQGDGGAVLDVEGVDVRPGEGDGDGELGEHRHGLVRGATRRGGDEQCAGRFAGLI